LGAPFILASGKQSQCYIDCRKVVLSSRGSRLLGSLLQQAVDYRLDELPEQELVLYGATGVGGAPLVGVMLHAAGVSHVPRKGFVVRDHQKEHGLQQRIEGHLPVDVSRTVMMVEDVITTGGSILTACRVVEALGHVVNGIFAIVDREEGGVNALRQAGYYVNCLLTAQELIDAPQEWIKG
jgi:orotate phosphoribosyltransferase